MYRTFRKQQISLILKETVKSPKNGSPVRVFAAPSLKRRTKDGSVSAAEGMAAVGRLARRRIARYKSLAVVCHHQGTVFATGRRTVTTWLRAVGVSDDFSDCDYFLHPLGRKTKELAQRLLGLLPVRLSPSDRVLFAVDDSPTQRYGPQVEGAGIHHNQTPGPAAPTFVYGPLWVTFSRVLRHPLWQTIGLLLLGLPHVRAKDIVNIPAKYQWNPARTANHRKLAPCCTCS